MILTLLATAALPALGAESAALGSPRCPAAVPLASWSATLGAAEAAYRSFEAQKFDDTLDGASLDLPCLSEVVSPEIAARYHLLSGLRLYVQERAVDAASEFASARAADPALTVDEALVPAGHELRSLIPSEVDGPTVPVPEPTDGVKVALDGVPTGVRPVDRPVIAQVLEPGGEVRQTTYVLPGDPLPSYPVLAAFDPGPSPLPIPEVPIPRGRPRWGALAASGIAAGASIGLYALAARSEARFNGRVPDDWGKDELVGLRNRTNGFVWGSVAAAGLATGGMVVFVVAR